MASIKVEAGDLDKGSWIFSSLFGVTTMAMLSTKAHMWKGERYDFRADFKKVELLDEGKVKKLAGTAGWGLAGAALLGPLGAIGGMLLGGNKKEVAFVGYLHDGRKFMASTDGNSWKAISAARFDLENSMSVVDEYAKKAKKVKRQALKSAKRAELDKAKQLLNDQLREHAKQIKMPISELTSLYANTHAGLAKVSSIEGNHEQALAHLLYSMAARGEKTPKQTQKLAAYFSRGNFKGVSIEGVQDFLNGIFKKPNLRAIEKKLAAWR